MPLRKPPCPACGSRFLVSRIRTGGGFFTGDPGGPRPYRCYRCFSKYRVDPETGEPLEAGDDPRAVPPGEFQGVLVDVDLDLRDAGAKHAVERFRLRLANRSDEPVGVDRIHLTFDDGETRTEPTDLAVLEPSDSTTVAVQRSWVYPDQERVRLSVLDDDETVGRGTLDLDAARERAADEGTD